MVARIDDAKRKEKQLMTRTGGIVVCGGESRRMGRPKAWLPFGAETILQRIVRTAAEAVGPLVVVAAAGQELPTLPPEVTIVRDEVANRGPLEGLRRGLAVLSSHADAAFATSCDVPLLRPAVIRFLSEQLGDNEAVAVEDEGRWQPLIAVYRTSIHNQIEQMFASRQQALHQLLARLEVRRIPSDELRRFDPELDSLRNVNDPAEYQRAVARAGFSIPADLNFPASGG